jgi:hypothetical protein
VVGAVERHEALRVAGRFVDAAGVVDVDEVVHGRVQHEQRRAEPSDRGVQSLGRDVAEEIAAEAKRSAGEGDLGFAVSLDEAVLLGGDESGGVGGVRGSGDRRHRQHLGDLGSGGQHGGASEAVADEERWGLVAVAEHGGGSDEVGHVGGERRVGELAFARAESREVEPQHGEARPDESRADPRRGGDVLAAGEAVDEEGEGPWPPVRKIEASGELVTAGAGEGDLVERAVHQCSGFSKSCRRPASHSERWLPCAGMPPASLSMRARCSRFQVMNVAFRLVKSLSGPPEPGSR